jgi:hypothetical protein
MGSEMIWFISGQVFGTLSIAIGMWIGSRRRG